MKVHIGTFVVALIIGTSISSGNAASLTREQAKANYHNAAINAAKTAGIVASMAELCDGPEGAKRAAGIEKAGRNAISLFPDGDPDVLMQESFYDFSYKWKARFAGQSCDGEGILEQKKKADTLFQVYTIKLMQATSELMSAK
ncbi:MAG: hypothetical protein HQ483_18870 [Rhodospirillales bacterium]|nr:hypothetical protein [Rhodospirillales bacterium]